MADYVITAPNGKKYKVTGQGTKEEALAQLQKKLGAQPPEQPKPAPQIGVGEDMLKSGASGLAQGAIEIPGMIGDTQQLTGSLAGKAAGWLGAGEETQAKVRDIAARYGVPIPGVIGINAPTSEQITKGVESVTGEFYKPQTTAGEYTHTVARFLPATTVGPGTKAMKFGTAVASGLSSEGAGQATEGTAVEPYARVAGAILGGVPTAAAIDVLQAPKIAGQTRTSTALLRNAVPQDASKLASLGDDAMLLDASPQMTGLAQGVSMAPTANKDAIVEALLNREKGRSTRLVRDSEQTLGPARDPEMFKAQIAKESGIDAKPYYNMAKTNPPDLRNDPALASQLAAELTNPAKGMSMGQRGRNMKVFEEIDDALMADTPQETVKRLHSLRQDLDNAINDTMNVPSQERAVAVNARKVIDKVLKERVPGFKEGDKIYAEGQNAIEAVDYGYNSLEGGKGAIFPDTFKGELKTKPREFVAEGMRARIANALGTSANDLAALKKMMGGDYDFNREKLVEIFGAEKVDKVLRSIDREGTFSQSYADIARNSQTAQRMAGQKLVDSATTELPDWRSISGLGLLLHGGRKGLNAVLGRAAAKHSNAANEALVKALTTPGRDAVALINQLRANAPQGGKALQAIIAALNASRQPAQ